MKSVSRWLSRSLALQLLGMVLIAAALFGVAAQAGTVTYVYTDAQGTPVMEADAQGNITATYDYTPYGSQALGTPPEGLGYTGHVNDPDTGLVYMQARYYDPVVGRFLSVDPVGPTPGSAYSFGRYNYASGNPINNIDPDGRDSLWVQDGAVTNIIIPVNFVGEDATVTNVKQIIAMAKQLEVLDRRYSITIVQTDRPMNGVLNKLDLSPVNVDAYPEAGEGVNKLGGNVGHINSSNRLWLRAAVHDMLHFAGFKDGYRASGSKKLRTVTGYLNGYGVDNIMAERRGNQVSPEEIERADEYGRRRQSNRICQETEGGNHAFTCL